MGTKEDLTAVEFHEANPIFDVEVHMILHCFSLFLRCPPSNFGDLKHMNSQDLLIPLCNQGYNDLK
jgi:hypothetical protein